MTATAPAPEAPTTTAAADPTLERIVKLEREVTKLRKQVRRLKQMPPIEISPELASEIDRRIDDLEKNPNDVIPWETAYQSLLARYGK